MSLAIGKRKNNRKYPGVKGKRPDLKKLKKEEAKERQAFYDSLSVKEKMLHLARQLKAVGGEAIVQLQKLQALLDKPTSIPKEEIIVDTNSDKKVKAKDRHKAEQEGKSITNG